MTPVRMGDRLYVTLRSRAGTFAMSTPRSRRVETSRASIAAIARRRSRAVSLACGQTHTDHETDRGTSLESRFDKGSMYVFWHTKDPFMNPTARRRRFASSRPSSSRFLDGRRRDATTRIDDARERDDDAIATRIRATGVAIARRGGATGGNSDGIRARRSNARERGERERGGR